MLTETMASTGRMLARAGAISAAVARRSAASAAGGARRNASNLKSVDQVSPQVLLRLPNDHLVPCFSKQLHGGAASRVLLVLPTDYTPQRGRCAG